MYINIFILLLKVHLRHSVHRALEIRLKIFLIKKSIQYIQISTNFKFQSFSFHPFDAQSLIISYVSTPATPNDAINTLTIVIKKMPIIV